MLQDLQVFEHGEGGMHDTISFVSELAGGHAAETIMRDVGQARRDAHSDYYNRPVGDKWRRPAAYDESRSTLYKRAYCLFANLLRGEHACGLVAGFRELISGVAVD